MLKGYDNQAQPGGSPDVNQGGNTAIRANTPVNDPTMGIVKENFDTLSNRLAKFSDYMFQKQAEVTADKAVDDALKDSAEGKPFYKQDVHTAYGKAYNNTASATFAANSELAISKKSTELSQQFFNDPTGYSEAMDKFVGSLVKGAPTPELRTTIGLNGQKTKNAVFGALTTAEQQRVRKSQVETFTQAWDKDIGQIVNMQAQGNMRDAEAAKQKNLEYLGTMISDGLISGEKAQELIDQSDFTIENGVGKEKLKGLLTQPSLEEARTYLHSQIDENRADMSVKQNDIHQASLQKMFSAEERARAASAKEFGDYATQELNIITEIMKDGGTLPYSEDQINRFFAGASKGARFKYSQQAEIKADNKDWGTLSIPQQAERIAFLEGQPRSTTNQTNIENLRESIKDRRARAKDDTIGLAIKEGVIPMSTNSMDAAAGLPSLLSGLSSRQSELYKIRETYGDTYTDVLSKDDADSWTAYFKAPGNTDGKLQFIEGVSAQYPELAKHIFRQVNTKKTGTFAFAATVATGGDREAARLALKGSNSGVTLEESSVKERAVGSKLGSVFNHLDGVKKEMVEGVMNYNRGRVDEGMDAMNGDDAVTATLGEVDTINGKDFILPKDADLDDVEDWLGDYEVKNNAVLTMTINNMGDMFRSGRAKGMQLHYMAEGQYLLYDLNNGKGRYISDEEGKPLILDYSKRTK